MEAVGDHAEVAKVHPVDEQVEGRGIGEGQEEDRMVGGAGHEAGLTIWWDTRGRAGCWRLVGEHEIEGEGAAEETAKEGRVGGEVVHV